jgi:hypothetical protein
MKRKLGFCIAAMLLGNVPEAWAADVTGKITLKGTPPAERPLPLDPLCSKTRTDKPTTRLFVVGKDGALADVFVQVKQGLTSKTFDVPKEPVLIDQKGCEYLPYIAGLQVGQTLLVANSDKGVLHNVHPTPAVQGNKEANRAQPYGMKPLSFVFEKPEPFLRFKCDVHNWMYAYVTVLDHPYYSVSDTNGTFKISNLPPGKYVIEASHRKAGQEKRPGYFATTKEITVGNENQTVDFTLEIPAQ